MWTQFAVLGVVVNVIFSLGNLVAVVLAGMARNGAVGSVSGRAVVRWIGGTILVGLGIRLAAASR